jgi:glycerol dehydrogenase-like iron-containing ADH family enzyme
MDSYPRRGILWSWKRLDRSSHVTGYPWGFQGAHRYRKQSLYKGIYALNQRPLSSAPDLGPLSLSLSRTTQTDVVKKVEGILREKNRYAATFYNIGEHSPISGIRAGVDIFKQSGADIIVSVGGGSPIDASKAIIYFLHEQLGGDFLRQIAIPTTLSAAEYSVRCNLLLHKSFGYRSPNYFSRKIGAGYTDEAGQKTAVSSQYLAPSGVILDAELTLATPERLWSVAHRVYET